tara:strand:- start:625 stop:993 length:369 start_codon:yes stop_codon:yes gene_type:complete
MAPQCRLHRGAWRTIKFPPRERGAHHRDWSRRAITTPCASSHSAPQPASARQDITPDLRPGTGRFRGTVSTTKGRLHPRAACAPHCPVALARPLPALFPFGKLIDATVKKHLILQCNSCNFY